MDASIQELNSKIRETSSIIKDLTREIGKVIVGQQYLIDRLLMALLADGHILIEGVPCLAKTLSVRTLSQAIAAQFQRIQFTPDLLPADVIGTLVYNPKDGNFTTKKGPIFQYRLDEINRAPSGSKTLLELCRNARLPSAMKRFLFRSVSGSRELKTRSNRRDLHCRKAQVDRLCLNSW